MTKANDRLAKARLDERVARARWFASLDELQDRTTASNIATEVFDGIKDAGSAFADRAVETVKRRPGLVAAIGSGLALFFLRKPIASAIRSRFSRLRNSGREETSEPVQPFDENVNWDAPASPIPDLAPRPTMIEEISQ